MGNEGMVSERRDLSGRSYAILTGKCFFRCICLLLVLCKCNSCICNTLLQRLLGSTRNRPWTKSRGWKRLESVRNGFFAAAENEATMGNEVGTIAIKSIRYERVCSATSEVALLVWKQGSR